MILPGYPLTRARLEESPAKILLVKGTFSSEAVSHLGTSVDLTETDFKQILSLSPGRYVLNHWEQSVLLKHALFHLIPTHKFVIPTPPSNEPDDSDFFDEIIELPDLAENSYELIDHIIGNFPCRCPRRTLVDLAVAVTRFWPNSSLSCELLLSELLQHHRTSEVAPSWPPMTVVDQTGNLCCRNFQVSIPPSSSLSAAGFEGNEAILWDLEIYIQQISSNLQSHLLVISGPSGSGKSFLAKLVASKFSPSKPCSIFSPADLLDPVVGASEAKLHAAICDSSVQAVVFEKADELFPAQAALATGSVQRLVGVALHAFDQQTRPFLAILEVANVADLHYRVGRRAKHVTLADALDADAQRRLFARLVRVEEVGELVDLTVARSGAECERLVREAAVKAVRRAIAQGPGDPESDLLRLEKQDFVSF